MSSESMRHEPHERDVPTGLGRGREPRPVAVNRTPVRYTRGGQPHSRSWKTHPTVVDQPLPSVDIAAPSVDPRRMSTERANHHI
jgi:hypothetical protein